VTAVPPRSGLVQRARVDHDAPTSPAPERGRVDRSPGRPLGALGPRRHPCGAPAGGDSRDGTPPSPAPRESPPFGGSMVGGCACPRAHGAGDGVASHAHPGLRSTRPRSGAEGVRVSECGDLWPEIRTPGGAPSAALVGRRVVEGVALLYKSEKDRVCAARGCVSLLYKSEKGVGPAAWSRAGGRGGSLRGRWCAGYGGAYRQSRLPPGGRLRA